METENKNVSDEKIIEEFIKKYGVRNILKQIDEEEIVDFYQADNLLDYIDERDIADYLDSRNFDFEPENFIKKYGVKNILKQIDESEIVDFYKADNLLDYIDERDIADYLESRHFDFEPYVDTNEIELKAIKEYENDELKNRYHLMNLFARVDFPRGFVTKDMLRDSFENFINDEMPGFLL